MEKTYFQVFDIATQTIDDSSKNPKQKFTNFVVIKISCHGSDFFCFFFINN